VAKTQLVGLCFYSSHPSWDGAGSGR